MKRKIKVTELDVDFIGEQNRPLTTEEQLSISAFIQKQKEEREKERARKSEQPTV